MDVTELRLDRFSGGLAAAVALGAGGILRESPVLLVAAAIPVVYVVYGSVDRVRLSPEGLSVRREIDRETAFPGDRVEVTVTVGNDGDRPIADLRIVDVVPDSVAVAEGRPRAAVSLRPGETATVEYTVVARRGDHEFGPVRLRARSTSASEVVTVDVTPQGSTALSCRPDVESVPLARQTRQFAGGIGTDEGGSGVEFHSTREYRRGDPVNRIDWRRLARGGELTTINFREQRTAQVLVLVDARAPCYVAPRPGAPTGAAMCGYGARRVYELLRSEGHAVGAAALGIPDRHGTGGPAWVEPGSSEEVRLRARELFETATTTPDHLQGGPGRRSPADRGRSPPGGERGPTAGRTEGRRPEPTPATADGGRRSDYRGGPEPRDPGAARGQGAGPSREPGPQRRDSYGGQGPRPPNRPPEGMGQSPGPEADPVDVICSRLSPSTQVLFFTPALDDGPESVVEQVVAYGHRLTVVSPDVTHDDTRGGRIRAVERDLTLERLRAAGARVVDWNRDQSLALTLASIVEEL